MPGSSESDETVGRLIDLDHAKVVDSSRKIEVKNDNSPMVGLMKQMAAMSLPPINVTVEVIEEFIKRFEAKNILEPLTYISDVMTIRAAYFGLDMDRDIKVSDMGWHHQVGSKRYENRASY
jgi:hypothetical protein